MNSNDFLFIFIVGHGCSVGVKIFSEQSIAYYSQIDGVLDDYSCSRIVVAIESCYSGSATTSLAGTNRLIITASGTDQLALIHDGEPDSTSYCEFAHRFINYIDANYFFAKAFYYTRKNSYVYSQDPLMGLSLEHSLARFGLNC